jgi:hypothetical protein
MTQPLALSNIVDISVTVSPSAASANSFNQGLFIGPSTIIPSYGTNPRLRRYTSLDGLLSDGFTSANPEYIAAQIYFSQTPVAQYLWIGRQDATAIKTVVPNGRTVSDGAITAAASILSSLTAAFSSADVGLAVRVVGAGVAGADLVTTVATYTDATHVVLASAAGTTVVAAQASLGSVGHGYAVNDTVTAVQSGASNGVLTVLTVGSAGQVLTLGVTAGYQGTAYTPGTALPTTTSGSGSGLTVNITAVGESLLQAAQACRAASALWYGLAVNQPTAADNLVLSAWADANWQTTRYYPWSSDVGIPNGVAGNLALQLQTLEYRVLGIYSTTQNGLYPNNVYAAAGVMGTEMGLNTGLASSFFTTAHKTIVGIATESLTQTQYDNITFAGFNAYCDLSPYPMFEPGFMSNGSASYLWLYLAMLVNNLQIEELNVLRSNTVVPQTNSGEHLLINAADTACAYLASIGFLAPATWTGETVIVGSISVTDSTSIPNGYLNLAASYATQSSGDRAAGKAMPIYCLITTAGAVQSLVIGVYAQL